MKSSAEQIGNEIVIEFGRITSLVLGPMLFYMTVFQIARRNLIHSDSKEICFILWATLVAGIYVPLSILLAAVGAESML
jgi:hypothetical protein